MLVDARIYKNIARKCSVSNWVMNVHSVPTLIQVKKKVKISLLQAMEAHRVAKG
jgi:hypothetical protein